MTKCKEVVVKIIYSHFFLYLLIPILYSTKTFCYTHIKHFAIYTLSAVAFVFSLWNITVSRRTLKPVSLVTLVSLFALWHILAVVWAASPLAVPSGLLRFASMFFIFIALYFLFSSSSFGVKYSFRLIVVISNIAAVLYLYSIATYEPTPLGSKLFVRPFGNPDLAGGFFLFSLAISISFLAILFKEGARTQLIILCLSFSILPMVALITSRSKGAIFALLIVILLISIILFRIRPWIFSILILLLLILCFFFREPLFRWIWPSLETRLWMWRGTWSMISSSFLRFFLGFGPGNFFACYTGYQDPRSNASIYTAELTDFPHNYLLEIWAELGLIGLSIFLFIMIITFSRLRQTWKNSCRDKGETLALLSCLVALSIYSQVSVTLSYPEGQILFWFILALVWSEKASIPSNSSASSVHYAFGILLCIPVFAFWKLFAFDQLKFQMAYSSAIKEKVLSTKIDRLSQVRLPFFETYYTLKWRDDMASALDEFSLSMTNTQDKIPAEQYGMDAIKHYKIIMRYTNFGNVPLKMGYLYARLGREKEATKEYLNYAAKNPFSPELWFYWFIACRAKLIPCEPMISFSGECFVKYGKDGVLLFGRALAMNLAGDNEYARELFEQTRQWLQENHTQRASKLEHYIDKFK